MRQNRHYQIFGSCATEWAVSELDIVAHNFKILDMEFMKKFRIQSVCKISISMHHCCTLEVFEFIVFRVRLQSWSKR